MSSSSSKKTNLLPDENRRAAKEALEDKPEPQNGEVKLVVPEKEEEPEANEREQRSILQRIKNWWNRRKEQKQRKRGETGSVKERKEETEAVSDKVKDPSGRAELFADVVKEEEAQKHWWEDTASEPRTKKTPAASGQASKEANRDKKAPQKDREEKEESYHEPDQEQSFGGPSVNLVPDTFQAKGGGSPWVLGGAVLVFVIAAWVIAGGVTYSRVQKAEAQAAQIRSSMTQVDKLIADTQGTKTAAQHLQKQYSAVDKLVNEHLYWTVFLNKLRDVTIPDVYYVSVDGDVRTNQVQLRAVAKDYAAAARQIRAFEREPSMISSVSVGQVTTENQPGTEIPTPIVTVDMQLGLKPGVLRVRPSEQDEAV